ncbi:hypothetical protein EDB86DRAFT_2825344 [Lactarius hatsudake]|nr:hypothetical protein EDB86DRAFT_2825344 [Lactarius hatsudake]
MRPFYYIVPTAAFGGITTVPVCATILQDPEWSQGPRILPPPPPPTRTPGPRGDSWTPYSGFVLSPTLYTCWRVDPRVTIDGGRKIGRGIEGIVNLDRLRGGSGP